MSENHVPQEKAPRPTIVQMIALEILIMSCDVNAYYRIFAWYRLVRIWTCCRADDTLHWSPSSMRLGSSCLSLDIMQTKTTGPDKRVKILHAYVSKSASLTGLLWLNEGFGLLMTSGFSSPRSFFLCTPTENRQAFSDQRANYEDISRMSRELLRLPNCPAHDGLT